MASLTIFQRSPHWAAPFEQFRTPVPEPLRCLLREVPLYRSWYRVRLAWTFNDRIHPALQKDPNWDHPERLAERRSTTATASTSPSTSTPSSATATDLLDAGRARPTRRSASGC